MATKTLILEKAPEPVYIAPTWTYLTQKINLIPTNNLTDECGFFYDSDGHYLGSNCKPPWDKVFVGKAVAKDNGNGTVTTTFESITDLGITHTDFQKRAATIYGESTAYISKDMDELAKEMGAIAYVHLSNKKAYADTSEQAALFRNTPLEKRVGKFQLANWAVINSLTGGEDYSGGASMWDGAEQSLYAESDVRGWDEAKGFEIHMNTMGWEITNDHYNKWKKNVGARFKAPQKRVSPDNYDKGKTHYKNKGKIRLYSTAVWGKTIFWRVK